MAKKKKDNVSKPVEKNEEIPDGSLPLENGTKEEKQEEFVTTEKDFNGKLFKSKIEASQIAAYVPSYQDVTSYSVKGRLLIVKVGNSEKPAVQEDIDDVKKSLVGLLKAAGLEDKCMLYVTHHNVSIEII